MVLSARLRERTDLTYIAIAMMMMAMLHDNGDDMEMLMYPVFIILFRLLEKDTFQWGARKRRTIDSFTDEQAKALFRFDKAGLRLLLAHLRIPPRLVLGNRGVVLSEEALLIFLGRLAAPGVSRFGVRVQPGSPR